MKYGVKIRMNNPGPAKFLITEAEGLDLNPAFALATILLNENKDCFAEIVEEKSNEVVATINGTSN